MEPNTFGKYVLLQRIAVGGMANVYLARQTGVQGFEKLVVVKIMLPQLATESHFVDMFLDEARLQASLSHPNIVAVYDLGREADSYFIAMEYVAGQDLFAIVKKLRKANQLIVPEIAARVLASACEGLHFAHTLKDPQGAPLKIVHRDVSPSNILVSYQGTAKVLDFGIAKAETQTNKTDAGTLKGKYSYMAPEQIRGEAIDGRVDVFALGITLYETLVGRRLYKRAHEIDILRDILEGVAPLPSKVRPDLPSDLDVIVMKALAKEPSERFSSAQAMQIALESWLASRPRPTTSIEVANFMSAAMGEELAAYQRLMSELPTASAEQLAALLAEENRRNPTGSRSAASDPRFTPSFGGPRQSISQSSLHAVTDEEREVIVKRPMPRGVKAALALVPVVLLLLGLVAWLAISGPGAASTTGKLIIQSAPPGAEVVLGGVDTGKATPTTLEEIPFGPIELRLILEGYEPKVVSEELSAQVPIQKVSVELVRAAAATGTLEVITVPPGAQIFVDGIAQGTESPLKVTGAASNVEHLVRASKKGFVDDAAVAKVEPGGSATVTLTLKPRVGDESTAAPIVRRPAVVPVSAPKQQEAELEVPLTSSPGADVFFQGKRLGHTPFTARLPAGEAALSFVNASLALNQTVTLKVDKAGPKSFEFKKGKLGVECSPPADVFIGVRNVGTTPLAPKDFYEGSYTVRLIDPKSHAQKQFSVKVLPGQTVTVHETIP